MEFRSLLEPVRVANPFVDYFEAACDRVDLEAKVGGGGGRQAFPGAALLDNGCRPNQLLLLAAAPALPVPDSLPCTPNCRQVAHCTSRYAYKDGRTPSFEIPYGVPAGCASSVRLQHAAGAAN